MLRGLSRSADGLIPLVAIGAVVSLVVLGAGAFRSPAYRDNSAGGVPGHAGGHRDADAASTPKPTPTPRPKRQARA